LWHVEVESLGHDAALLADQQRMIKPRGEREGGIHCRNHEAPAARRDRRDGGGGRAHDVDRDDRMTAEIPRGAFGEAIDR
jgi:hypothetical protein